ncbi:hypothetical protein BDN72DRAFT_665812 [Pluteus cervinus]|uniref:Uncharacterized protein n=1 Tax=Pluteus cervinus TaxID=181527 RepID=A0ACD3BAB0_9AGAR|nr:hypothetical protein BDN72DRAFT_665812 [Pluteus cervinus]
MASLIPAIHHSWCDPNPSFFFYLFLHFLGYSIPSLNRDILPAAVHPPSIHLHNNYVPSSTFAAQPNSSRLFSTFLPSLAAPSGNLVTSIISNNYIHYICSQHLSTTTPASIYRVAEGESENNALMTLEQYNTSKPPHPRMAMFCPSCLPTDHTSDARHRICEVDTNVLCLTAR